jgi:DUF438 domain-containing protein
MQRKTFNDFLREKFFRLHPGVLDDDIPEKFDAWVSSLDASEIMEISEEVVSELYDLVDLKVQEACVLLKA